jgi:hypothetical protein
MALRDLLNQQAGNARRGQRYRDVVRNGQRVHDYASGPDQVVGPAGAQASPVGAVAHAPTAAPQGAAIGDLPAGNLADLIAGQRAYEERGGQGGPVLGSHMHDGTAEGASVGRNAEGQVFSQVQVGGRKFHVYVSPSGDRVVREIKPQRSFTPTPAA